MEISKTTGEQMAAARQLEKTGRLSDAAAIYQKLFNSDPGDQQVIGRLLVMYRKLKDYRKELSVLNDAIGAHQQRRKAARERWIQSHPKAASAGRSMLRQLEKGGNAVMGLGEDAVIERWMKRKDWVANRITGKKGKRTPKAGKILKAGEAPKAEKAPKARKAKNAEKAKNTEKAKKAAQERREAAARQKREERERKAAEAQRHPSLFVIILRYLVSLEEIDAVMKQHIAYLDKHYDSGDFLVSGRQVPRTGGVILARGKDRAAVERTIKQDPFVKRKLASADIIEFTASQFGKGLERWLI